MGNPIKHVLVTGASGLVGSACVELFESKGWKVTGIDNNQRSKMYGTPKKPVSLVMDIRDSVGINHLFQSNAFDAIIHAAGQPSHDWATNNPIEDFQINAFGTLLLLEACRQYTPDAVFVYVSTDKVYGENMDRELVELETRLHSEYPFNENEGLDFAGIRSFFGCSKTAADLYVQDYGKKFGIKTACFRPGCITGKNHEGAEQHGFLAYLAKCIRTQTPYTIYGFEGKQVRDQIHAKDLANAFYCFIERPRIGAVFNIGGGPERSVSVLEAIAMIEKKTGKEAIIKHGPARAGDRPWDVHDVSKFKGLHPEWSYQYSLQDIIDDVCQKDL